MRFIGSSQPAIRRWHKKMPSIRMLKKGNWKHIAHKFHTIRPSLSEDNVEPVCAASLQSPRLLELRIQSKILYQTRTKHQRTKADNNNYY